MLPERCKSSPALTSSGLVQCSLRDTDPQYISKGASDDRVKPLQLQRGLRPRPCTRNCTWFLGARLHHGPCFRAPARKLLDEDASPDIDLAGGRVAVIRCQDLHVLGAAEQLAVHPAHQTARQLKSTPRARS